MAVAARHWARSVAGWAGGGSSLEPIRSSPGAGIPNTTEPARSSWPIGVRSWRPGLTACNGHYVKLRVAVTPDRGTASESSCVARAGSPSFTGLGRRPGPPPAIPGARGGGSDRPSRSPVSQGEAIDCPAPARIRQKIFLSYENCPRPGTRTRSMAPFQGERGELSLCHGF